MGWPSWFVALAFAVCGTFAIVLGRRMRGAPERYAVEQGPRWGVKQVVFFGRALLVLGPAFLLISVVELLKWVRDP